MFVVLGFKRSWTSGLNYSLLLCSKWEFINKAIFVWATSWPSQFEKSPTPYQTKNGPALHFQCKHPFDFLKMSQKLLYGNQKPPNTSWGLRQTQARIHPSAFFHGSVFRASFLGADAVCLPPLSVSLALPVFGGTWRDIRQGSETDCNSSVHFSAASSEPGSSRWPSWAPRGWACLHRCSLPALLRGTLGGEEPDLRCRWSLQLKCRRLEEENSFLWNSGILEVTFLSNGLNKDRCWSHREF